MDPILRKALIGALTAAVLGGGYSLIRQTVYGFRGTATKRGVIICSIIYGILGILNIVNSIIYKTFGLSFVLGIVMEVLCFALIKKNFLNKSENNDDSVQTEKKDNDTL